MNVKLMSNFSSWLNFSTDNLVLVKDIGFGYWNALMASPPRHVALAAVIKRVCNQIERRSYGRNDLDITGPRALGRAMARRRCSCPVDDSLKLVLGDHPEPCGAYPRPHCYVRVEFNGSIIAEKENDGRPQTTSHYSYFYPKHQVYCDEP